MRIPNTIKSLFTRSSPAPAPAPTAAPSPVSSAFDALWNRKPGPPPELQEWFDREARPALILLTNRYLRPDEASTLGDVAGRAAEMLPHAIDQAAEYARDVMGIPWRSWAKVIDLAKVADAVDALAEGFHIPPYLPYETRLLWWRQWLEGFPVEMCEALARDSGSGE